MAVVGCRRGRSLGVLVPHNDYSKHTYTYRNMLDDAEFIFDVILTQKSFCDPLGGIKSPKMLKPFYDSDFLKVVRFC